MLWQLQSRLERPFRALWGARSRLEQAFWTLWRLPLHALPQASGMSRYLRRLLWEAFVLEEHLNATDPVPPELKFGRGRQLSVPATRASRCFG